MYTDSFLKIKSIKLDRNQPKRTKSCAVKLNYISSTFNLANGMLEKFNVDPKIIRHKRDAIFKMLKKAFSGSNFGKYQITIDNNQIKSTDIKSKKQQTCIIQFASSDPATHNSNALSC